MRELVDYVGGVALFAMAVMALAWVGAKVEVWLDGKRAGRARPQDFWDD